jgi:hypothetical protein
MTRLVRKRRGPCEANEADEEEVTPDNEKQVSADCSRDYPDFHRVSEKHLKELEKHKARVLALWRR